MKKLNVIRANIVTPPVDFEEMEKQGANARRQVDAIEVTDVEKYRTLASVLVSVKALAKNVVSEFEVWVKKAYQAHKECLAARNKYLDVFVAVEADAKQKLALFCAESGTIPQVEGITVSEVWKFEIIDPAKIPAEFLKPDEKMIGDVVKAMKIEAARSIPGIRVWSENKIAVTGAD